MKIICLLARATFWAVIGLMILAAFLWAVAQARPSPQWADIPVAIREWFQSLMQPDNPYMSCCGEADSYEADNFEQTADGHYVAIITQAGSVRLGQRVVIPDGKIKWDKGNPTGHGYVFIGTQGQVYCYVTPGGV